VSEAVHEGESGEAVASLRMASATGLLLSALFIVLFDRAKHDPDLLCVNPFAVDPFDAVGSFGVQVALAAGVLAALKAFRPSVPGESFPVRQAYVLRSVAVSQTAIAVTALADIAALALAPAMWYGTQAGNLLILLTAALLVVPLLLCALLIRIARHSGRCSQNPLRAPQMVPFLICMALLVLYPAGWREGIAGAFFTAAFGMAVLLLSVALLAKAMFPCPEVPEVDFPGDLQSIWRKIVPRKTVQTGPRAVVASLNPRVHPWRLVVIGSLATGLLLALAEFAAEGPPRDAGRVALVIGVFLLLESGGVCLGYFLLRHFLGVFRNDRQIS